MNDERPLRSGSVSASLDGADLVDLRWGGLQVADRIFVSVRDPDWGTIPAVPEGSGVEQRGDGVRAELAASHRDFAWRGVVELRPEGVMTFEFDGEARRSFAYRRIGICVLHPWRGYVGATYRAGGDGPVRSGTFPRRIAPQPLVDGTYRPMIDAFTWLEADLNGTRVRFDFGDERFELEDQRNWTDASFKTYPTPLDRSEPSVIRAGERIVQKLSVRIDGPPIAASPTGDVVAVEVGEGLGRPMPAIGVVDVADLRPAHVRVELRLPGPDAVLLRNPAGVPIELALLVDDPDAAARDLDVLARQIRGLPLARVLVHHADGITTPPALIDLVRDALGPLLDGVPVVGGSSSYFSELNRHPVDPSGIDGVAFGISPTVHATDDRSIMSTLPIQSQVVEQTREDSKGLPVLVTPVTLDDRSEPAFVDAWTLGSVAELTAGGASSITYAHATPALAPAISLEGEELRRVTTSDDRVAAIAAGSMLILANLVPDPQRVALGTGALAALEPYEVRELALDDGAASS